MKPLVSILIPCYNAENWLAETLESALAQTWTETEIIVVDDGSTDQSLAIAQSFINKGIKVISQTNRGASAARNKAFQTSQGDFIQYLDADDLLAPDKIERQIALLQNNDSGYIAAGEWARFYQTYIEAAFTPQPLWADMSPVDWLVCAWEDAWMMHPAAWLVPRQIAAQAGFWNEALSLNDDGEYFSRVVLASQGIKFCWGAKSFYRSGNLTSLSGAKTRQAWESAFLALELGTQNLLAIEDTPRTRHACATAFQRFIYEMYPDSIDLQAKAAAMVNQLGGSNVTPMGGPMFHLLSFCLGWKKAKQMQNFAYRYGYRNLVLGVYQLCNGKNSHPDWRTPLHSASPTKRS